MWNRPSPWLIIRMRQRGAKPRFWLCLVLALYVLYQLLLAWQALVWLLPGAAGAWARGLWQTLARLVLELLYAPPLTLASMDFEDGAHHLSLSARTCNIWGGGHGQ